MADITVSIQPDGEPRCSPNNQIRRGHSVRFEVVGSTNTFTVDFGPTNCFDTPSFTLTGGNTLTAQSDKTVEIGAAFASYPFTVTLDPPPGSPKEKHKSNKEAKKGDLEVVPDPPPEEK